MNNVSTGLRGRTSVEADRGQAAELAVREARRREAPVLLTYAEAAPPRRLAGIPADEPWFCWRSREHATELWAAGAVLQVEGTSERFVRLRALHANARDALFCPPVAGAPAAGAAPLCVGGIAFAPRLPTGMWDGWPAAWAWVPARLWWTDERAASWRVERRLVRPTDTPAGLTASLLPPEPASIATPVVDGVAADVEWQPLESPASFAARVARAEAQAAQGAFDKVVLARAVQARAPVGTRFDPGLTLDTLSDASGAGTAFGLGPRAEAAFVGLTPERLVRLRDGRVESVALAGTVPRGAEQALCDSDKDRREHQAVVDYLRETFLCWGEDFALDAPQVRSAEAVVHLETRVRGRSRPAQTVVDWLEHLYPTPAVAGLPRDRALAELAAGEPLERGYFSGAVGWIDAQGQGDWAVALRSALLRGRDAWLFAGAGIVAGSRPELEWQETELKLSTMRRALRLARETP